MLESISVCKYEGNVVDDETSCASAHSKAHSPVDENDEDKFATICKTGDFENNADNLVSGEDAECLQVQEELADQEKDALSAMLVLEGIVKSDMHVIASPRSTCPDASSTVQEAQITVTKTTWVGSENASLMKEVVTAISNTSATTATNISTCFEGVDKAYSGISSFEDNGKGIGVQEVQGGLVTDVVPTVVQTYDHALEIRHTVLELAIPDEEALLASDDSPLGISGGPNPDGTVDVTDGLLNNLENAEDEPQKADVGENILTLLEDIRYQGKEEQVDEQITGIDSSGADHAKELVEISFTNEFSEARCTSAFAQSGECSQAKSSMELTPNKSPLCDSTKKLRDVRCTELIEAAETKEILVAALEYPQETSSKKSTLPSVAATGNNDESVEGEPQISVNFVPEDVDAESSMVMGQEKLVEETAKVRLQQCESDALKLNLKVSYEAGENKGAMEALAEKSGEEHIGEEAMSLESQELLTQNQTSEYHCDFDSSFTKGIVSNEDIIITDDVLEKTSDCEVGKDMAVDDYVEASPLLPTYSLGSENDEDKFSIICKTSDFENNADNLAKGEDAECLQQLQEELVDQEIDALPAMHSNFSFVTELQNPSNEPISEAAAEVTSECIFTGCMVDKTNPGISPLLQGSGPSVLEGNSFKNNAGSVEEGTDAESSPFLNEESYWLGDEHDENLGTSLLSTSTPSVPELENGEGQHVLGLFSVESQEQIKREAVSSDSKSGKLVAYEENAGMPPASHSNFSPTSGSYNANRGDFVAGVEDVEPSQEVPEELSKLKNSGCDPSSSFFSERKLINDGYLDAVSSDSKGAQIVEEKENTGPSPFSQSYRLNSDEDATTSGEDSKFVVNGDSVEETRDVVSSDSKGAEIVVEERENAGSSPFSRSNRLNSDEDAATSGEDSDFVENGDLVEKTRDGDSFELVLDEHAYLDVGTSGEDSGFVANGDLVEKTRYGDGFVLVLDEHAYLEKGAVGAKVDCENFKDAVNRGAMEWASSQLSFVELVDCEGLNEKMTEADTIAREDVKEDEGTELLSEKSAEKFDDHCDDREVAALTLFEKRRDGDSLELVSNDHAYLERESIPKIQSTDSISMADKLFEMKALITEIADVHNVKSIDKDEPDAKHFIQDASLERGNKDDDEGSKLERKDYNGNAGASTPPFVHGDDNGDGLQTQLVLSPKGCSDGNLNENMTDKVEESMELSSKRLSVVEESEMLGTMAVSSPKNDSGKYVIDEINCRFSRIYISSARKGRQFRGSTIQRTPMRPSGCLQPDLSGSGMKENVQTMKTEPLASRPVERSVTKRRPLEDLQNSITFI
ncbi:hypothetical protein AQUCO_01400412v1 [Aquilegia coerulea]|uniref:Uncharacterized protein n=1 Tax=Aquilegia coerulea TaxID=218851 RepID=A0A2G5DWB3_AQUCA|nr:hypothetical protein AQUCO_01400412v1 [Aquilegia coerulea]